MKRFLKSRKAVPAILAAGLLAALLVPETTQAGLTETLRQNPDEITLVDLVDVIVYLIEIALSFAAAVGMIYIVVAGYQYVLSAGNPEKIEKAKNGLTWAISGFILAISSTAIVYLVQQTLKSKSKVTTELGGVRGPDTAAQVVEALIQLGLAFGAVVAVLFLVLGGYRYMTSQGNQTQTESAKNTVLYSMIGLVVIFLSTLIFRTIKSTIT